ncbi:hypothetical protein Nepgr_002427 [Nepenthes gracilis]|uniref:Uncharacterized protein n=1 Tax=Nepenthes gracilis TaxID=150966 RepID=A0AAD3RY86_NEPGR|nr:hypothetical protein Nepgr_002427 [Nepenthes gracilis]
MARAVARFNLGFEGFSSGMVPWWRQSWWWNLTPRCHEQIGGRWQESVVLKSDKRLSDFNNGRLDLYRGESHGGSVCDESVGNPSEVLHRVDKLGDGHVECVECLFFSQRHVLYLISIKVPLLRIQAVGNRISPKRYTLMEEKFFNL